MAGVIRSTTISQTRKQHRPTAPALLSDCASLSAKDPWPTEAFSAANQPVSLRGHVRSKHADGNGCVRRRRANIHAYYYRRTHSAIHTTQSPSTHSSMHINIHFNLTMHIHAFNVHPSIHIHTHTSSHPHTEPYVRT